MINIPERHRCEWADYYNDILDSRRPSRILMVKFCGFNRDGDVESFISSTDHTLVGYVCDEKSHGEWHVNLFNDIFLFPCDSNVEENKSQIARYLVDLINEIDIDYIVVNCQGTHHIHEMVTKFGFDPNKILAYSLGWIPHGDNIHFTFGGFCSQSILASKGPEVYIGHEIYHDRIDRVKNTLYKGKSIGERDYILCFLQTEIEHRKRWYSNFFYNQEFLDFVDKIAPSEYTVLVKGHPHQQDRSKTFIEKTSDRFINITDAGYSVGSLIENSKAVVTINSTVALEAPLFGKPVFTYGRDVFTHKGTTFENIYDEKEFKTLLDRGNVDIEKAERFASFLMDYQVPYKIRQWGNDTLQKFAKNHILNEKLYSVNGK